MAGGQTGGGEPKIIVDMFRHSTFFLYMFFFFFFFFLQLCWFCGVRKKGPATLKKCGNGTMRVAMLFAMPSQRVQGLSFMAFRM
jgi:hypothetical protein